jgi:serine/threonine protein kinase
MRLITGGSLNRRLRLGGVLSPTEVSSLLKQLVDALEYVYSCGFVHGNLRTSNVIFDQWGSPFLTDFSFAELTPKPDTITGTPAYLAPEKWRSEPATPATDQYALGAMVYKMLTDHLPFEGDRVIDLMQKHLDAPPPPLTKWRDDLPLALDQVVLRTLAKTPEARYPNVTSFANAFDEMVRGGSRQVFISYSHSDSAYAQHLREQLVANRFDVWIDHKIGSGDQWFGKIQDAIKSCAAVLVIMSADAEQSEWVEREILLAQRFKKPIFPLLLNGEGMGLLINIQHTDVRGDKLPDSAFFRRLQRSVFGDL